MQSRTLVHVTFASEEVFFSNDTVKFSPSFFITLSLGSRRTSRTEKERPKVRRDDKCLSVCCRLIFCKPALKIFQPLKMLKRIAFLRQLRTLRPSSHPLILAWAIVFYPHMDSWDATSFEIAPHRRTFESPNRSVTKSTLWRSSGLLNQTDTRAITSMRILERPEYVSLSASWEP